jgi:hypothetical protein
MHAGAMLEPRRHSSDFQPHRLGVEEGPFTHTITRRFRLTPKVAGRLTTV